MNAKTIAILVVLLLFCFLGFLAIGNSYACKGGGGDSGESSETDSGSSSGSVAAGPADLLGGWKAPERCQGDCADTYIEHFHGRPWILKYLPKFVGDWWDKEKKHNNVWK